MNNTKIKLLFILIACSLWISIFVLTKLKVISFLAEGNYAVSSSNEILKSLPYVSCVPIKEEDKMKMGVVIYKPLFTNEGFNIYCSRDNEASLMDMRGRVLHTWSIAAGDWTAVAIDENGDLFFVSLDKMLVKLDWNSKIIWKNELRFHHYIYLAKDGNIYSLTRKKMYIPDNSYSIPILDDYITILSSGGTVKQQISIFKLFGNMVDKRKLEKIKQFILAANYTIPMKREEESPLDIFHANSIQVINKDVDGLCKKGDILLSIRELNIVAIVDPVKEKVIWSWGENYLERQHSATFLDNGNILIFDNGYKRNHSRIVEVNPITKKVELKYVANPPSSFFCKLGGAVHKLASGNMLITDTMRGRVFEITKEGEIVWDFYNPVINEMGQRAVIMDMTRLSPEEYRVIKNRL